MRESEQIYVEKKTQRLKVAIPDLIGAAMTLFFSRVDF